MRFPSSRIPKSEKISVLSDSEKAWGKAEIKVDGYFSSSHRKQLSEKQLYCNIMMYNSSTSEMSVVSPTSTSASESSPSSLAPLKKRTEKKWGSPRQIYRKEFSTDSSDGVEKHARHRKEEEDLAIAAARVSEGSDSIPSIESAQPRLRTVDEYLSKRRTRVIIVSGSPPFHVQYANKAWSNACGWSSEEVLGLDCKFLQGEATSMRTLRKFLANIAQSEEPRELSIMNYKKDDTLLANRLICYPIKNSLFSKKKPREEGPSSPSNFYRVPLSHFVCVLEESDEAEFTNEQMISRLGHQLEEVGLPIDRREQSKAYPYLGRYPAPKLSEWAIITKKLTVSLALQYMLETQAPAMLVDR
jgi:PAS domain-containing protein